MTDKNAIKELDQLIFEYDKYLDAAELYTVVLGISIYRLQKIIGRKFVEDLLVHVLKNLENVPSTYKH